MQNKLPLVSIIIPTYKRSDYILETLNSIFNQTYPNIEIIVVDDNGRGSRNQIKTEKKLQTLIKEQKIKYIIHQTNKNGSAARNTGFIKSRGKYINFLDDDDKLLKDKIEKQVTILEKAESIFGATYCNRIEIIKHRITGNIIEKVSKSLLSGDIHKEYLLGLCEFSTSCILFRRECIENLNGFDESYFRHQDVELMTRFFIHYKILSTSPEPLIIYDTTKDRINMPNSKKLFQIKEKYLTQFQNLLIKWNIWEQISHNFWLECAIYALSVRDYEIYKKSHKNISKLGGLTFKEHIILIKKFISGCIMIIIQCLRSQEPLTGLK